MKYLKVFEMFVGYKEPTEILLNSINLSIEKVDDFKN
jgi:hypothetical protein